MTKNSTLVCIASRPDTSFVAWKLDTVLLADAVSRAATNQKQWYVSISRGRRRALIFTPDRAGLRANLQNPGDRELALSLELKGAAHQQRVAIEAAQRALAHQAFVQQQRQKPHPLNRGIRHHPP